MIGIFDSGVGGMTVARAIEQFCPGYPLIYFGDLARMPYGPKSPAMITEYAHRNTDFLLRQGARLIVIACNSAASVASAQLRSRYPERIIDVIDPAVARAAAVSANGRIGLIGTLFARIGSGAAGSWSINNLGRRIAKDDYDPGFFIKHFVKDMGIALAEAKRMRIALPGLALAEQLYVAAMAQGLENMGTQALFTALKHVNGMK